MLEDGAVLNQKGKCVCIKFGKMGTNWASLRGLNEFIHLLFSIITMLHLKANVI